MSFLVSFLPDTLTHSGVLILVAMSFLSSALTAAVGLGGGVALITVMAMIVPPAALVPVHGVIQIGSNTGRAAVLIRYVDWRIGLWFALGALFGAASGGLVAVQLPEMILKAGIGVFALWVVWGRPPRLGNMQKRAMAAAGFVSTFLSMFFGAAGPIGGAVLSTFGLPRYSFVANQAITALTMHIFKVIAFGTLGFAYGPWLGLITLMILSGFLGTLAGSRLLGKMNEKVFKTGFKWVMTALALNLILQATGIT